MDFLYFILTVPYQIFHEAFYNSSRIDRYILYFLSFMVTCAYILIVCFLLYGSYYLYAQWSDRNLPEKTITTYATFSFIPEHTEMTLLAGADGQNTPIFNIIPDQYYMNLIIENISSQEEVKKDTYDKYFKNRANVQVTYRKGKMLHIDQWKIISN